MVLYQISMGHELITSAIHYSIHTIQAVKAQQQLRHHMHYHETGQAHNHTHKHLINFESSFHHNNSKQKKDSNSRMTFNTDKHLIYIVLYKSLGIHILAKKPTHFLNQILKIFVDTPYPPPKPQWHQNI